MFRVLDWVKSKQHEGLTLARNSSNSVCIYLHGDPVCIVSESDWHVRCPHVLDGSGGVHLNDLERDWLCEALACLVRVKRPDTKSIYDLPFRIEHLDSMEDYLTRDQLNVVRVLARVLGVTFPRLRPSHAPTYWVLLPCASMLLRLLAYYRAVHIARVLDRVAPLPHAGQLAMLRLGVRVPSLSHKQQEIQLS